MRWYRLAAAQGDADAKNNLKKLLKASPKLAAVLKAAEQADKQAKPSLAGAAAVVGLMPAPNRAAAVVDEQKKAAAPTPR